jgi:molybdopterin-guanine dinucleotide biosynthesis protein A
MYYDITAFILSGGKSKRMGTNKSLLTIGGLTVIERVVKLVSNLFQDVILITNQPEDYSFLNLKMYKDLYKDIGPLAGIHSALVHTSTDKNFIISCDIPLMTSDVIKYIVEYPTTKPITITKADNFIQQLCGLYDKSLISAIDKIIQKEIAVTDERNPDQKKRGCSVLDLVNNTESAIIDIEKEFKDYQPGTFYNMNRPEEYKYIESILQKEL